METFFVMAGKALHPDLVTQTFMLTLGRCQILFAMYFRYSYAGEEIQTYLGRKFLP
jgi:hypothetical protein